MAIPVQRQIEKAREESGGYFMFDIKKWQGFTKAEREYKVWRYMRPHPRCTSFYDGLAKGVPFPKFMTDTEYYTVSPEYSDKTVLTKVFSLTEKGKANKEVAASYKAWYNYENPYTLKEE